MEAEFPESQLKKTRVSEINPWMKTQICKRFMEGTCFLGSNCNYAHGYDEIRQIPRVCRMFSQNRHCSYGHNCRFLHSTIPPLHPQLGTMQNAGYNTMQTFAPATIADGSSSAQNKMVQASTTPATNASASGRKAATPSFHKNGPYKDCFDKDDQKKVMKWVISRFYGDWI